MKYVLGLIRFILILSFILPVSLLGQGKNRINRLQEFAKRKRIEWQKNKTDAEALARKLGMPLRREFSDGTIIEVIKVAHGAPLYYITHNANAAITTRTDHLWPDGSLGLSLTGSGYNKLGEWDGGAVRISHQEFDSRITQMDSPSSTIDHATHVAGTLVASGIDIAAKGMAYQANLLAYDWNSDVSEMASAAGNGMEISNHSYGYITGWFYDSQYRDWWWFGDPTVSLDEDYNFGYYGEEARTWDEIAYNAPNYLIVKSAGNDRGEDFSRWHYHAYDGGFYNDSHDADGGVDGYDCISYMGVAKNVLTVGAVYDVLNYTGPSDVVMSSFSGWGPADDGRIKPDIVSNGISLYSTFSGSDSDYGIYSGTSMASPNTAGTLALLQQHYQNTHGGTPMRSATIKALVLHTADEAGSNPGPDYKFGWGLLNAEHAAQIISTDVTQNVIFEQELSDGKSYHQSLLVDGEDPPSLKVTVVWTDPPGTPVDPPAVDPPNLMLVHDLDLSISDGSTTFYPWTLDPANPDAAAVQTTRNFRDNVEQVYIASPAEGFYAITVNHSGNLSAPQEFSLIIEGATPVSSYTFEAGSTDPYTFPNTDVTIKFTTPNSEDVSASVLKQNSDPGIYGDLPTGVEHVSPQCYWNIQVLSGTVDGTYTMSIDLDNMGGISDYATLKLLKRSDATSSWEEVGTNSYDGSGMFVPWTDIDDGFSEFAIGGAGDNSLPVTLSIFQAKFQNGSVLLEWQSESEVENLGYIIRRRDMELNPWLEIASYLSDPSLIGQGNCSHRTNYYFIDYATLPSHNYQYQLADVSYNGQIHYHDIVEIKVTDTALPIDFTLKEAYPNPFNPITTIQYGLPEASWVKITVYDLLGKMVNTLVDNTKKAGWHKVTWDGTTDSGYSVGSGLYLFVFKTKDFHSVKKLVLIR